MARKWNATRQRQQAKAFRRKKANRRARLAKLQKPRTRRPKPATNPVYEVPSMKETD